MSHLLDTHTFLWTLFEPDRLGPKAKEAIQNPANTVCLSVVTFWEISLKYSLGKLILKHYSPEDLIKAAARLDFEILDLSAPQAASFHNLPRMPHKDPFDRMIVWQAIQNSLVLITRDKELEPYQQSGLKTLW